MPLPGRQVQKTGGLKALTVVTRPLNKISLERYLDDVSTVRVKTTHGFLINVPPKRNKPPPPHRKSLKPRMLGVSLRKGCRLIGNLALREQGAISTQILPSISATSRIITSPPLTVIITMKSGSTGSGPGALGAFGVTGYLRKGRKHEIYLMP